MRWLIISIFFSVHLFSQVISTSEWSVKGDRAGANLGFSVASAGDVNGDGYSDVIVGARWYSNGETKEGAAYLYHGSASGLSTAADWSVESNKTDAFFGWSVASAGDVNKDGYDDVIIGARWYSNGHSNEGRVFLYHGSASGLSSSHNWSAESDQNGSSFGYSVASAGDVNKDGYSDVIIGAPHYDVGMTDEGRAYIYLGSASGLSTNANWIAQGGQEGAAFGFAVATAGDVNKDGYDDVIVGAPYYHDGESGEGHAFLYYGSDSVPSLSADWTTQSDQNDSYFGWTVAGAGDVNADGYDEVIVAARLYDNVETDEGRAFLYHGSTTGPSITADWSVESNQSYAELGRCYFASAGDVNGDGYDDVILGSRFYDYDEINGGAAFLHLGSASGLSSIADWSAYGDEHNASFGRSVASAGDVNGDGCSDLIIGAYEYDNGEIDAGAAFLYYGVGDTCNATKTFLPAIYYLILH